MSDEIKNLRHKIEIRDMKITSQENDIHNLKETIDEVEK